MTSSKIYWKESCWPLWKIMLLLRKKTFHWEGGFNRELFGISSHFYSTIHSRWIIGEKNFMNILGITLHKLNEFNHVMRRIYRTRKVIFFSPVTTKNLMKILNITVHNIMNLNLVMRRLYSTRKAIFLFFLSPFWKPRKIIESFL